MSQYRRVKELTLYDAKRTELAFPNRKIYVSSLGENRISIIIKHSDVNRVWFDEYIYCGAFLMRPEGLTDEEYQKAILGAV